MQNCLRLSVPVPPMLEAALGYAGTARYVALYWRPAGDALVWDEGWRSADGAWQGCLTFTRHPRVAPALAPYEFGDSDTPATHWLLLDREARTCCVGTAAAVQQALYMENPAPDMAAWPGLGAVPLLPALTENALQAFLEGFRDVQVTIAPEEIHQQLAAHARVLDELTAWLDAQAREKERYTCAAQTLYGSPSANGTATHDVLNAAVYASMACHGPRPPLRNGRVSALWRSSRSASACARAGGGRCSRQGRRNPHAQHKTL
jgi:hypothetical protein